MRKTEEDQGAKLVRYMLGVLIGGAVSLVVCLLLLLLASVGISSGRLALAHKYQITMAASVVSTLIGGLIANKRCETQRLLVGLAVGAVYFLLLLTVGLLFFDAQLQTGEIGLLCGSLFGGAVSGLLGGNAKKGKRRKRRK